MNFLIVDGNSIINRSFYAIKSLSNGRGESVGGVYGFINTFTKYLNLLGPEYVAVAFDVSRKTFRTEVFKEYKATRKETPSDLISQIKVLQEILRLAGYSVILCPGFEADDIIGTLSSNFASKDLQVSILTGDRDSFQLVNSNVCVYLPSTKSREAVTTKITPEVVLQLTGALPNQIVDLKALMGDSSDNIPGCSGIGPKKAAALISEFGDVKTLYDNLDRVKGNVRNQLTLGKESVFLSQTLAQISTSAPIDLNLDSYTPKITSKSALIAKLDELDMKTVIEKIDAFAPHLAEQECLFESTETLENFAFITDINSICNEINAGNQLFIAANLQSNLIGINTSTKIYNMPLDGNLTSLVSILSNYPGQVFIDNAKDFYSVLGQRGLLKALPFFCCVTLAGYILDSTLKRYSLSNQVKTHLAPGEYKKYPGDEFVFGLLNMPNLCHVLIAKLKENKQLDLMQKMELPLSFVLVQMELFGMLVDLDRLMKFGKQLQEQIDTNDAEIFKYNDGVPFNVNSAAQLGAVLFEKLKLPSMGKTKNGFKTDAESLAKIVKLHPIVKLALTHRQLVKLKTTYVDGLLKAASSSGRVHCVFRQTETKTGRLSSAEPNLQNIPVRTELGARLRNFFVAAPGFTLVDADYSQIELRVLAQICKDEALMDIFKNNLDIHKITASEIFNLPLKEVTEQMRRKAKAVNFGIIYGIGPFALAEDIGVSFKEASQYIKNYLAKFPGVEQYTLNTVNFAKEHGFVCTLFGRRIYIPELAAKSAVSAAFGKRVAYNAPIQGTAADIIKLAMVNLHARLNKEKLKSKIVLQVHDEIILESPLEEASLVSQILRQEMASAANFDIPLEVNIGVGPTWAASH